MTEQEQRAARSDETQRARQGWHDDPISTVSQDYLRRAPFAKQTARLIGENHTAESSVVYGLEGPWGSGKSSVIALISSFLTDPPDNRWSVVPFTPWATSGTEALLAEFFAALGAVAPQSAGNRRLRDRVAAYADIARPIAAAVPMFGTALAEASRTVEERLRKPWNIAFAEVAAELRRLETPILIVVDDIDRLQPAELLDLLKVVRLLGRFPGVDFLLAYDEQTLVETLQDPARGRVSTGRARAFMEKIVQYPLSLPPLLTGKIVKMLDAGLTEILTLEKIKTGFDTHRFSRVALTTMPSQLTTPRAIERFLAQIREQFRIHDLEEVNDVDLILATFLRVQFPDLFAQLQRWKTDLTRGSVGYFDTRRRDAAGPDWDQLLSAVEDDQGRRDARAILETLFPALSEKQPMRADSGRFAHPEYFDRYLAQTIPEGDIPDAVIARSLAHAASGIPDDLRALILDPDDEQVTLALSKIRVRYPDIGQPWTIGNAPEGPVTVDLLSAGMGLLDQLKDRVETWSTASSQTTHWMSNLLRILLENDPNAEVDRALAACTRTHRRAHVLTTALRSSEHVGSETQHALRDALRREVESFLPDLLNDLRLRDSSEVKTGYPFLYGLVDEAGLLPDLRIAIREGLDAGEFTLEDVAARLVSFAYAVGGPAGASPSSASFLGDLFTKVTGFEAASITDTEREDWSDTNWARRRAFAANYIGLPADEQTKPTQS